MSAETKTPLRNEIEQRKLLQEYERRQRQKEAASLRFTPTPEESRLAATLRDLMFPEQRAFFDDPANRKVGFCTRRAGKTIGTGLHLLASMLENPMDLFLYMAQTRELCKLYLWKELKELVARYNLPFEFNENFLWMKHTRCSATLILRGADNEKEVNKLRGPKWRCAVLDESSTYGAWMEQLVVEVIGPALRDQNGTLILIGTAGRKKEGLFYEACHGIRKRKNGTPIYRLHQWSLQDNPHLSADAKDLDLIMEEEGLTAEDPRFLREYMMLWVSSDSERVWSGYAPERNDIEYAPGASIDALRILHPGHKWEVLLGMDFGWQDESGIAVVAYSRTIKKIYCLETWAKNHAFSDEIATKVFEFRGKYGARRCVGDIGGQGKIFQQQLLRDYQIFVEPASKLEKTTYIEFMNSAFLRADLMVPKGDGVCSELLNVAWDEDRKKVANHEKDNRGHALMYGWRAANTVAGKQVLEERGNNTNAVQVDREKSKILNAKPTSDKPKNWWDNNGSDSRGNPAANQRLSAAWRDILGRR